MWGIVPAAGSGTRIQPLAFSKELLPVGSRFDGATERPRAVSEYLIERMLKAGADKICFVISPWKSDILQYYGGMIGPAAIAYVVQPEPAGLCDAIFRALPLIARFAVKTASPDAPIRELSGGNVQRAVLARELADPCDVLIAVNPCFGLDFAASAEIRAQLVDARNRGTAVLLISEDLDELLELSDRLSVIFDGAIVYETPADGAEPAVIGAFMAGQGSQPPAEAAPAPAAE